MQHRTIQYVALAWSAGIILAPSIAAVAANAAPNDYSRESSWLCRPGRKDACAVDLGATVIAADGIVTKEAFRPDPEAPVDCFYVYPTVSREPGLNGNMTPGLEEANVAEVEAARFTSKCRLFVPLYRQSSVDSLGSTSTAAAIEVAYGDVHDAWTSYLANDNHGRAFVLIGHSQGSRILTKLIQNEIDGKALEDSLVSALLVGSVVAVPGGKDVGGTFQHIPLCRATDQIGCVISYSSFLARDPPPAATAVFGKSPDPDQDAACVNPASLNRRPGVLDAYLPAGEFPSLGTPFIKEPDLFAAQCVTNGDLSYLAIAIRPDRRAAVARQSLMRSEVTPGWGLHLLDLSLALGNLVDLVGSEAAAWSRKAGPR